MNDPEVRAETERLPWYRQRLLQLILGSIMIALLLVFVAMALYNSSGSAQLDLSRPGYQSVQDQVNAGTFESFPADGSVDEETLDQFLELYDKQTRPVDSSEAFLGGALSDEALGIEAPDAGEK